MNITGTSQRTLDRFNRMELLLRQAGIKTEYSASEEQITLTWQRIRNGTVVERGDLWAFRSVRTGNLRFCGGGVAAYSGYDQIKTYRDAWNAINLATEMARRTEAVT